MDPPTDSHKETNANQYIRNIQGKYRSHKSSRSYCGQGSMFGHRGKIKAYDKSFRRSKRAETKMLVDKGLIGCGSELSYLVKMNQ